jgi:hypothetical protein
MTSPTYHALLIGIDAYPPGYNSLSGCVNDIDAIEQVLLDPPGIGIPPEQIHVTRLAAANPRRPSTSRLQAQTLPPTKANVIQALKALAGPEVKPEDRVLIYYSGHGDQKTWTGSLVWHEALIPHNGQQIEYFYDVEVNALINAISMRTSDLTIILDCCHSAGATRDISDGSSDVADRRLVGNPGPAEPPDLAAVGLSEEPSTRSLPSGRILQNLDPSYLVIVACQPDEKAGEGQYPGEERSHGILTYSLISLLQDRNAEARAGLHWADIWSKLLEKVSTRCAQLGRRSQVPWYIGRTERRVFGGSWQPQDLGYSLARQPDGRYQIEAGTLMGLTQDSEVAVYGPTPALFPELGSKDDRPIGRLRVATAERASSVATAIGPDFDLPDGARVRLVKPGKSERLSVVLKPEDPKLAAELRKSTLLEVVPAGTPDADIEVVAQPDGGWTIGNDTEAVLALVPPREVRALRAGLNWYYRYHTVLQLAKNCNDPQLNRSLSVRLLDCSDKTALQAMTLEQLADPNLTEVNRDEQGIYFVQPGSRSCVKISNTSSWTLQVTLLDCSAGGLVQYMGDALLRPGASHVLWSKSELGRGFPASPDMLPALKNASGSSYVTDRLIAIGTTRRDVNLGSLKVEKMVQDVVNENLTRHVTRGMIEEDTEQANPAELWTATVTPVRIARR